MTEQPPPAPEQPAPSRRSFLRRSGLVLGGLVVGGAAGAAAGIAMERAATETAGPAPTPTSVPGFEHVVVLMGENRSFDNLLGQLYTPDTLPAGDTFDGLAFGDYGNIDPVTGERVTAFVYEGATDTVMGSPRPDPGEEYAHVNTQLFGTVDPKTNAEPWKHAMASPYNTPPAGATPDMSGFLHDYYVNYRELKEGETPTPEEAHQIMGGFSPDQLPVLSTLARGFAVFDAWFCAVPSQTYCNRSFFHASTSHGFVTNRGGDGYGKWLDATPTPTVFNRLEEAGISWKIYFDEQQLVSLTGVMHAPVLEQYWRTEHFAYMSDFYADAKAGTLPAYAFIEPRMIYDHNDFHPPFGVLRESDVEGETVIDSAVSDVRAGERLVARVYEAVRDSATADGSNALNTLLLVTFDEHGGTYDHVPPPAATPPEASALPGEMGFTFDRLGGRVPTIAVSAYTRAGTIIHDEMHHAAVIATLSQLHGLAPLTRRDDGARDLFSVVNLDTPRDPSTWPAVHPMYLPPNPDEDELADLTAEGVKAKPLSPPARGLLGLLLAKYEPGHDEDPSTYGDAHRILQKHGPGLFSPKTDG